MSLEKVTKPLSPDLYERLLAASAVILLTAVVVAVIRGQSQWGLVPLAVWGHLSLITVALALTPIMLLRRRGDGRH